jgi:hypothetical protein
MSEPCPQSRWFELTAFVLLASALSSGCASVTYQGYPGDIRSEKETAVLMTCGLVNTIDGLMPYAREKKVDLSRGLVGLGGKLARSSAWSKRGGKVGLLPGEHSLDVQEAEVLEGPRKRVHYWGLGTAVYAPALKHRMVGRVNLEAGHVYTVESQGKGNDWVARVVDVTSPKSPSPVPWTPQEGSQPVDR